MAITLMPLPYPANALEPHISAETLTTHHDAHHKAYVEKVNEAISGTPLADCDLETIVKTAKDREDHGLYNNAAQAWNHGFYWNSLTPKQTAPAAGLADAITRDFGSASELAQALTKEAGEHFGSGWAWLIVRNGKLTVMSTHDADTALTQPAIPLLTIDVWEHAYYLDVKNKRPDYIKAVVQNCLNWRFASENYDRSTAWSYPESALAHHD